jgi:diguanylate cyclase (GGDEF)-like protein
MENPLLDRLDLDRLKQIDDNLGHRIGDELSAAVAAGVKRAARASDTVARFGGAMNSGSCWRTSRASKTRSG